MVKNVPSASWDGEYGEYEFKCDEANLLGNISVLFGGQWLEILGEDLVVPWYWDMCNLCLSTSDDVAIFGMAFLRGYYSIHDMETTPKRMGFVP